MNAIALDYFPKGKLESLFIHYEKELNAGKSVPILLYPKGKIIPEGIAGRGWIFCLGMQWNNRYMFIPRFKIISAGDYIKKMYHINLKGWNKCTNMM